MTVVTTGQAKTLLRPKQRDSSALAPRVAPAEAPRLLSATVVGDFISTSLPWLLIGVTMLPFVLLFLWLIAIYFGIEYRTPPLDAGSVPPPRLY